MEGLSPSQVRSRLNKYGLNEIKSPNEFRALKIFFNQFNSFLILILIFAGLTSIFLKEVLDGIAILAIVFINAIIGFLQEFKAENAVAKLKTMVKNTTIVIRAGQEKEIPIQEIVPDDIVLLNEGDKIPADMEIIESFSLQVDESMLTGESNPVNKQLSKNKESKDHLLFKGTIITTGRAKAKVLTTGMETEFGKIIKLINTNKESKSPLTKQLDQLARKIGIITLSLIFILFILGILRNISTFEMLMTSVALGVSAIPEGLPIIVTLTLATGVQVLARKKGIVRKMNSVETLGATTVICSDKTGTLTLNEMTVKKIYTHNQEVNIPGIGYKIQKHIKLPSPDQRILLEICQNCNNSIVHKNIIGDPTEIALKILAQKAKQTKDYKRLDEKVFTSERKMMTTLCKVGNKKISYTKGAFETILKNSSHILKNGKKVKLTAAEKKKIQKIALNYSQEALRVLGLAYNEQSFSEEKMTFVGLVAMVDPPRKTVPASIKAAQKAGIKVKIITGDNAITAKAIGEKIGLTVNKVITGEEIDKLNDKQLLKVIQETQIFARTKPEHKYRIVDLLQKDHEVVAVTGDGVNDAPALKHADVGIAMGIKGTEATKEVADIILKDDNFSTIVTTIEEGRRIYQNILSFVKYMVSANFITIIVVGVITILGYPLPILALQILWLNIATDSFPALALGQSPAETNLMSKPPQPKKENMIYKFVGFFLSALILQVTANFLIYLYGLKIDSSLAIDSSNLTINSYARTLLFTQTVVFEILFAFVCKDQQKLSFKSLTNNHQLVLAGLVSFGLQLGLIYLPQAQEVFKTVPLELEHWLLIFLCASTAFLVPAVNQIGKRLFSR